jgi:transcriptional regulator with XRE-family HTH domain
MEKAQRPSEVFRGRMREVRERRGWTQEKLAERLRELGAPMDRATLARTEGGKRGLSLDEALTISAALGPSPLHMFVPLRDEPVQLAPELVTRPRIVRQWVRGQGSLREEDNRTYSAEVSDEDWARRNDVTVAFVYSKMQNALDALADGNYDQAADIFGQLRVIAEQAGSTPSPDEKVGGGDGARPTEVQ